MQHPEHAHVGGLCHQQLCGATEQEAWLGRVQMRGCSLRGRLRVGDRDDSLWMESFAPEIAPEESLSHCQLSLAAAGSRGDQGSPCAWHRCLSQNMGLSVLHLGKFQANWDELVTPPASLQLCLVSSKSLSLGFWNNDNPLHTR